MNTTTYYLIPALIILVILLGGGAFFSAIETALVAISSHRLKTLEEKNPSHAAALRKWTDDPNRLLTTMLIGINVVAITSALVTEYISAYIFNEWLQLPAHTADIASKVFSMIVVSVVVIELCEIVPKIIAYHNAERTALKLIRPLVFIDWLFSPLGKAMVGCGNLIVRLMGGKTERGGQFISQAEILGLLKTGEKEGIIEREEREMIHSIFEFGDTTVKEVMVPCPDIVAAELPMTISQMAAYMEEEKHSRIPIYEEDIDNIVGIVNARPLMYALKAGRDHDDVRTISHDAYFIPETKKLDDLLHEFQSKRLHMAIVVDEYGATAGLVTIEDLIEEIVGEIQDEYDTEEPLYRWMDDTMLRVEARMNISDLKEVMDEPLPEDESYDTLGGLIFALMGKVPRKGESVSFEHIDFTVERMTGRRINTVVVKINEILPPASMEQKDKEKEKEEGKSDES